MKKTSKKLRLNLATIRSLAGVTIAGAQIKQPTNNPEGSCLSENGAGTCRATYCLTYCTGGGQVTALCTIP